MGLNENERSNLAIVVTELGNNVLQHAGGGKIVLQPIVRDGLRCLDVISIDKGPGMRNVAACLQDGYSTAGTAGQGLGAVSRLSLAFDIFSTPDHGTVVFSRIASATSKKQWFDLGVISLPIAGESVCGDSWSCDSDDDGASRFLIADGLGHGPGAAEASMEAVRIFEESAGSDRDPARSLTLMHVGLHHTRGAAAAIASIRDTEVTFAGIGNIQAAIVNSDGAKSLASHNGTIGHQTHKAVNFTYTCPADNMLVMASDGINTQWKLERYPGLLSRHPGVVAGVLYRDFTRGRDDVTALVAGAAAGSKADIRR